MFMVFNVIFIVVTGLASTVAITADHARDARQAEQAQLTERARLDCASAVQPDGQCPSGQEWDRTEPAREHWR